MGAPSVPPGCYYTVDEVRQLSDHLDSLNVSRPAYGTANTAVERLANGPGPVYGGDLQQTL